ncbi:hypothetical protein [Variovorax sp. UMC13]|uniref:hypothetical protein n=1 Tax=Variovorax sp. UMC13 TaxID=1862326 RepID=UPI0016017049|nr:hypothetical protein [Variovorax sp. UMC13]MBB1599047.1 hypothetical protein [Variovorax sp. UMC13]
MSPLLATSDKSFWHGFLDFYALHLPPKIDGAVIEFGVFKGHSIRWLIERFPEASITGADILPVQPEWPLHPRVRYRQMDQDDASQVVQVLAEVPGIQLIIEDGSHMPKHQSTCLKHGLQALQAGGTYILEDIHTSHPAHSLYQEEFGTRPAQTSLSVLLAFEHLLRSGRPLTPAVRDGLARGAHFDADDIESLFGAVASIHMFKRATLPTSCWRCGSSNFDYHAYRCECGVELMGAADSMTLVVKKRGSAA